MKSPMPRGKNKEQILKAGLSLLYTQGFSASGVQEIANASGVPKGSFYNYFKSKEAFAEEVLERYTDNLCSYLEETLLKAEGSPLFRLRSMFEDWAETFKAGQSGCLAGNLSQELATQNPVIKQALEQAFDRLQSYYTACLEEAQAAGELSPDADPQLLASFIYNAWQGAQVRAKAQEDSRALDQFLTVVFDDLLAQHN